MQDLDEKSILALGALGILGIIIILIIIVVAIAFYVANAYPLYMILKSVGYDMAWLAWIPFCQYFAITMAFNYKKDSNITIFGIQIPRPVAGFASLIALVLSKIPVIGPVLSILALLVNAFILCEMFDVCENTEPEKNMGMAVISALIIFVQIFTFFKYLKRANNGEIDVEAYSRNHSNVNSL